MNEELAIVLGLVLAVIAIVLAFTFMHEGTDATIGSMDIVESHTDRDVEYRNYGDNGAEVVKCRREAYRSQQASL